MPYRPTYAEDGASDYRKILNYVEDVLSDRAEIVPSILFGAGVSGAIALLSHSGRDYALRSAFFGGLIAAGFSLAVEQRSEAKLRHAIVAARRHSERYAS